MKKKSYAFFINQDLVHMGGRAGYRHCVTPPPPPAPPGFPQPTPPPPGLTLSVTLTDSRGLFEVTTRERAATWLSQDIRLLLVVRARINRHFILPARLQSLRYCNTIARPLRNIRPAIDPSFSCHAPYNVGHDNIV